MAETWGIKGMAHMALTAAIDAGNWEKAAHVLERKRIGFKRLWGWLDDNYAFDKPDGLERTFDNICECTQFKKDVLNLYYEKRWNSALATMIDWQIETGLLTKWLESEGRELSPDFRMYYIRAMSEIHYGVAQAIRPVLNIGREKAGRTKTPTNLREKQKIVRKN